MSYREGVVGRSGLKPMGILVFCVVLFITVAGRVTEPPCLLLTCIAAARLS